MDLGEALREDPQGEAVHQAVMLRLAATPHQAEAVEALQLDGVQNTPIPMPAAPPAARLAVLQAVTRCTLRVAVVVPREAAPGTLALFVVCSRKSTQPKRLCTITVAAAAHLVVTSCDQAVRPAAAVVDTPPTDTPVLVSSIQPTWGQRLTNRT